MLEHSTKTVVDFVIVRLITMHAADIMRPISCFYFMFFNYESGPFDCPSLNAQEIVHLVLKSLGGIKLE